mgnify:CR=1 FL=1
MKKLLSIVLLLFVFNTYSQNLVFEQVFIKADDVQAYDGYLKDQFSKIHQKRINDGILVGWDAWKVIDTPQEEYTHMVTYIYDFDKEPGEWNGQEILAFTDQQMKSFLDDVNNIRNRVGRVVLNDLASVRKKGADEVPNIMIMNFMKVKDDLFESYEKAEISSTKNISNNSLRVGWNFHRRLDNYGTDTYASHITIDWFNTYRDYLKSNMDDLGDGNESQWNRLRELKKRVAFKQFIKLR